MKEKQALEQPFLDRANALTNVAEVFRCSQVTILIFDMVAFGVRAEAKIFEVGWGLLRDGRGQQAHRWPRPRRLHLALA